MNPFTGRASTPVDNETPAPVPAPGAPSETPAPVPVEADLANETPTPSAGSPANETPAAPSPRKGRRLLEDTAVEELRQDYQYARGLARDAATPEEWETVGDTEKRLGREYGLSTSAVHEIVLGLRYPDAPGPIDTPRRARYDQYLREREYLGEKAARARMRDTPPPPSVVVSVTTPDGATVEAVYPPGTVVSVRTASTAD